MCQTLFEASNRHQKQKQSPNCQGAYTLMDRYMVVISAQQNKTRESDRA